MSTAPGKGRTCPAECHQETQKAVGHLCRKKIKYSHCCAAEGKRKEEKEEGRVQEKEEEGGNADFRKKRRDRGNERKQK